MEDLEVTCKTPTSCSTHEAPVLPYPSPWAGLSQQMLSVGRIANGLLDIYRKSSRSNHLCFCGSRSSDDNSCKLVIIVRRCRRRRESIFKTIILVPVDPVETACIVESTGVPWSFDTFFPLCSSEIMIGSLSWVPLGLSHTLYLFSQRGLLANGRKVHGRRQVRSSRAFEILEIPSVISCYLTWVSAMLQSSNLLLCLRKLVIMFPEYNFVQRVGFLIDRPCKDSRRLLSLGVVYILASRPIKHFIKSFGTRCYAYRMGNAVRKISDSLSSLILYRVMPLHY
jgi:hypothetical protein